MTPPDSGEREVLTHTRSEREEADREREEADRVQEACTADHAGPYVTICLDCAQKRMRVFDDLPLAQRILAALEEAAALDRDSGHYERADKNRALAAELRAIVERKT